MSTKLDMAQKHLMRLVAQDAGPDGWTPVSGLVLPLVRALPSELVEAEQVGGEGRGRARLTQAGTEVMRWV